MAVKDSKLNKLRKWFFRQHSIKKWFVVGIAVFLIYRQTDGLPVTYTLIGPPFYIAYFIKQLAFKNLSASLTTDLALILPVTLIYFSAIGYQFNVLAKEQGIRRVLSIIILILFLIYIHFKAWSSLNGYYT